MDVKYEVGDSVYLSTRNLRTYDGKLLAKWVGPYLVTELRKSGVSVKLDLRGELGKTNPVFHVSQLKPYEESELEWPGRQQHQRPAPELVDGETEWEVEAVVDKETRLEKKTETKAGGCAREAERWPSAEAATATPGDSDRGSAGSVVQAAVARLRRGDVAARERLPLSRADSRVRAAAATERRRGGRSKGSEEDASGGAGCGHRDRVAADRQAGDQQARQANRPLLVCVCPAAEEWAGQQCGSAASCCVSQWEPV